MPVVSKTGHHFSMNIIDDFSSYVWSLPLKVKSDAMSTLITWHHAIENQMGQKLKILICNRPRVLQSSSDCHTLVSRGTGPNGVHSFVLPLSLPCTISIG